MRRGTAMLSSTWRKVDVDLNQLRRHYQCMVDDYYFYQVRCGMNFPEIYIIFLCNYDYFGYGLARYYTGDILDDGTEIEDGRHMIVLNSQYRDANVSHQIKEMLDRIRYSEKIRIMDGAGMIVSTWPQFFGCNRACGDAGPFYNIILWGHG